MRKEKSIKNFLTDVIPYLILTLLGFARLRVMLDKLGVDIYALNQVFIQLFSYISMVEAGAGTLITQCYYKYFAKFDKDKINAVFTTSKRMLRNISILMMVIGFVVSFFLGYLTNNSLSLGYMQIVFMLYLFRSVLEYLTFSPRFVLNADQKMYKINVGLNVYRIIEIIVEMAILQVYQEYIVILISSIILRAISYYMANRVVYKEYPWLKKVEKEKAEPITGMGSVMGHKLAGAVYNNTDILLLSAFQNPIVVTIYSSYNYITKFISDLIYKLGTAITASMGNVLYAEDDSERQYNIFENTSSIFSFCAMFFVCVLFFVTNKFVALWIGEDKTMGIFPFAMMLLALFNLITIRPLYIVRDVQALYKETRLAVTLEAVLNLVLSFIFVNFFGLVGVLAATIIATMITTFIKYPILVYKEVFKKNPFEYYKKYLITLAITAIICVISYFANFMNSASNYIIWAVFSAIYCIIVGIVLFVINYAIFPSFRILTKEVIIAVKAKIASVTEK